MSARLSVATRLCPALPALVVGLLLHAGAARAEEMRIFTRVYNDAAPANDGGAERGSQIVARSVSLFHAGQVYDFIDGADELTVFDPANQRFTILNTARSVATIVEFEQLRQLLKVSRGEAEKYVARLESRTDRESSRAVAALKFQLDPKFHETWDADRKQLVLRSDELTYTVRCAVAPSPTSAENYLRYADWTARLNHVLHPQALFPESRLRLDESLRTRGLLPIVVDLQADLESPLRLRAEHQVHWELDARDRSLIHRWETLLKSPQTRWVTFREYQRIVLAANTPER
jgi:hypothetical protein